MTKQKNIKPNYNDSHGFENSRGESSYLPEQYKGYTDSFYEDDSDSNAGSFLAGAIVGGVIGAAAALFLAPKTGKEMREGFSTQAVQLKDKGMEMSSVAKEKATEFTSVAKDKATELTSVAKEKTDGVTKTLQEQSGQIVDKVKTMRSKTSVPMDDGTASSEGEGEEDFAYFGKEDASSQDETNVATAMKDAVKDTVVKDNK